MLLTDLAFRTLCHLLNYRDVTVDCADHHELRDELLELDIVVGALDRPGSITLREDDSEDEDGYYVPFRDLKLEVALRRFGLTLHGNGDAGFYVHRERAA